MGSSERHLVAVLKKASLIKIVCAMRILGMQIMSGFQRHIAISSSHRASVTYITSFLILSWFIITTTKG
ncbi:hypothetical protein ACOSQ3_028001 [Xanthoceras sorbifolium]